MRNELITSICFSTSASSSINRCYLYLESVPSSCSVFNSPFSLWLIRMTTDNQLWRWRDSNPRPNNFQIISMNNVERNGFEPLTFTAVILYLLSYLPIKNKTTLRITKVLTAIPHKLLYQMPLNFICPFALSTSFSLRLFIIPQ